MKVLILHGSPRKKGNTAKVISFVADELVGLGHETETVFLSSKNLNGCLSCGKCKEVIDDIGCVQQDDILEILQKMVRSQLVIYASPLYFWGVSAQLKTIIDRTYSLYTQYHAPDHASLVDGQRQALLVTGGGSYEDNAEAAFTAFNRLQKPHKAIKAGELFIGGCTTPAQLDDAVKEKAIEFAKKITA
ncbi:MAG: flavodoxin family protein [Desulfobacteraceae bacterium]|nr:flavodoxin family protein [Desulfobacteraceae bacterium]